VPFPLNPTFRPPVPISDEVKSHIYLLFMRDPKTNSVRALSEKYHISMKRIDAILRLKGLEQHWKKGKVLQRGFLKAMEWHLGVDEVKEKLRKGLMSSTETLIDSPTVHEMWLERRKRVSEADLLDTDLGDHMLRARYERMFFEPVVEGDDPIMPSALEQARQDYLRATAKQSDAEHMFHKDKLRIHTDPLRPHVVKNASGAAEGRPTITFIDVGGRWVDEKDQVRRAKASMHRALVRSQR
ncbi:eukaryotic mitochondrial regulator protein-domain-containing protein, partial [Vararia minispora EC-137]